MSLYAACWTSQRRLKTYKRLQTVLGAFHAPSALGMELSLRLRQLWLLAKRIYPIAELYGDARRDGRRWRDKSGRIERVLCNTGRFRCFNTWNLVVGLAVDADFGFGHSSKQHRYRRLGMVGAQGEDEEADGQ